MSLIKPNFFSRFINWLRTPKQKSPAQLVSDPRKGDPAPKLFQSTSISDEKPTEDGESFDPEATLIMTNGGRKNGKIPTE